MTSQYTLQQHIHKLDHASCHEERLYKILESYMELFPVKNAYLFRFSPLGYLAEEIILLTQNGIVSKDISELTVKQYVKSAIKKLGAQNRSHAVGEQFRKGIIS
ncbi:hypothetical protein V7161_30270 [Neobacillus drentensis]|uniref:hypothetical protein n=1 Tax=Neobacillus drentensis TaxID=220684 RepID=UPI003001275B